MTRVITLPATNQQIPISVYVQGIRKAKQYPHREFKHGLTCWWPCSGSEIMKQFMVGVYDRINQAIPYYRRGTSKSISKV